MRMLNIRQVNKRRKIVAGKTTKIRPKYKKKTFCLVPESLTRILGSTLSLRTLAN
jgi:hypothetical protein